MVLERPSAHVHVQHFELVAPQSFTHHLQLSIVGGVDPAVVTDLAVRADKALYADEAALGTVSGKL